MSVYAIAYSSGGSTAVAKELFNIQSTASFLQVLGIHVGQSTGDYTGSTEVELLAVTVHRGSTLDASGGTTGTVINMDGRSGATGTALTIINSSSPGSSGTSSKLINSGIMVTGSPYKWEPPFPVVLGLSERLQVRLSAPQATITTNGVVYVRELGKNPNG